MLYPQQDCVIIIIVSWLYIIIRVTIISIGTSLQSVYTIILNWIYSVTQTKICVTSRVLLPYKFYKTNLHIYTSGIGVGISAHI